MENQKKQTIIPISSFSIGPESAEDKIVDMFWAESSSEKARQNLYNAVYHIRRVLGSELGIPSKSVILIKHSTYTLNPSIKSWYDVNEFERLYSSGLSSLDRGKTKEAISDFKIAVELYTGRLLEIYYDDWVVNYGYQLQERLVYMLKELASYYLKEGNYQSSISYAQRILEEDICDQDAYYIIMESYSPSGKTGAGNKTVPHVLPDSSGRNGYYSFSEIERYLYAG